MYKFCDLKDTIKEVKKTANRMRENFYMIYVCVCVCACAHVYVHLHL
jgi:hypothetical protein